MCATIYFNINILHMYRNIYSKRWETDCFRRPGGFLFFFDGGALGTSSQSEQQRAIRCIRRDDESQLFHSYAIPTSCNAVENPLQCVSRMAHGERTREGKSSTNDFQMENKNASPRFFPEPICPPPCASFKVSFKTVICLLVWRTVTMSAGHLLGLVTCETVL